MILDFEISFLETIRNNYNKQSQTATLNDKDFNYIQKLLSEYPDLFNDYRKENILNIEIQKDTLIIKVLDPDKLNARYLSLKDSYKNSEDEPPEPETYDEILTRYSHHGDRDAAIQLIDSITHAEELSAPKLNTIKYFDLIFDFENNRYWREGSSKYHSFQIMTEMGKYTKYYPVKVLIENKGKWINKACLEETGFIFSDLQIKDCAGIDAYIGKNINSKLNLVSDGDAFSSPRKWLKYDKTTDSLQAIPDSPTRYSI